MKTLPLILQLFLILFFLSCRKEFPEVIKVKTGLANEIMANTAILLGEIIDTGEGITDYGHCWSLHDNPRINDSISILGNENKTKSFISEITYLEAENIYYYCSYARRSNEIVYGEILNFCTSTGIASLTTSTLSEITLNSAESGGNISSDGGSEVITRGVCWNISGLPTVGDSKTEDGNGIGDFTSSLKGLIINTEYFIRAYAVTDYGISYGEEISFFTLDGLPDVITSDVTNITPNSATCGGNVTSDDGFLVTSRGVVWDISSNPTLESNLGITSNESGLGTFTSNLTNLAENTIYNVRAYATNSYGTSYGEEKVFVTEFNQKNSPMLASGVG